MTKSLNQSFKQRNSVANPIRPTNNRRLNEGSELAQSPKDAVPPGQKNRPQGSKLEPVTTKESVNLRNITEKRLKNSETCPEQLSPTLPESGERLLNREGAAKINTQTSNNALPSTAQIM